MKLSRPSKTLIAVGIALFGLLATRDTLLLWVPGAAPFLPPRIVFVVLIAASFLAAIVMAARASSISRQSASVGRSGRAEEDGGARRNIARQASLALLGASILLLLLLLLMLASSFLLPSLSPDSRRVAFGVLFVLATISFFGSVIVAQVGRRPQRAVEVELVVGDADPKDQPKLPR